jgi:hypothetical protein
VLLAVAACEISILVDELIAVITAPVGIPLPRMRWPTAHPEEMMFGDRFVIVVSPLVVVPVRVVFE